MPPSKRRRANETSMKLVGAMVAAARTSNGLTQRAFAEALHVDVETIASIEQGRRALMANVAELMDRLLGLPGLLTIAAERLPEVDVAPPWTDHFFDYEAEAIGMSGYEPMLVPGLLQTEEYARAVFRCRVPYWGEVKIEFETARRIRRQQVLNRRIPPSIRFVMGEAALLDRLGGDGVYRRQLSHLSLCADRPGISLQVLPLGITTHAGLAGSFTILETPDHQRLVYLEAQRRTVLLPDVTEVSIFAQKYAMLQSQALNSSQTKDLLTRLLAEV
ncbi:helix-turn-helix domain-containing protein [Streptomyces sp. NPDC054901]